MISVKSLEGFRKVADSSTKKLEQIVTGLEDRVEAITADETLAAAQRAAKVKQERKAIEDQVLRFVREIQGTAKEVLGQREFWSNDALILSQQRFPGGESLQSIHAEIALWHSMRLAKLPLPQLALEFQHARMTNDFAMLSLVLSERGSREVPAGEADHHEFDMRGVQLPGQTEALDHLSTIAWAEKFSIQLFRPSDIRSDAETPHAVQTVRDDLQQRPGTGS